MKIKKLKAVITGGKDQFGAWIEEVPGAYGAGETIEETKQNLLEGLNLYIEENENIPAVLKADYEIDFTFDTSGFLKYYSKYISFAGMKEITGINQKQLWSYANGYRNPSKETSEKILNSIQLFGEKLLQAQLRF
ncbi:type II toxin-antitoxin system HicB family antitoxin [Parabacteroides sp. PF5-9]|uniref:type II toxin-antitoxin system HicB family antitoxin n=1 Tax=Parabacteroides sp. PF5-9 TaxID=1742404 RepID=UPI0024762227|nr:type II toxin-antitoxin system HicB family antitoxin [Parabacteroides sp. PF5-9]MDH6358424.1 putative RNase H-like HicB family nuclease [Parabacteroides sp. PF5-9]